MSLARYSPLELKAINDSTSNRLPPASAVHGMAMYELNRDAEQERLFHSAMFDLSELKHTSAAHAARTDSLERAVKACASHHDNERPVSLAGVQSIQHALNDFSPSDADPKAVVKRANWLLNELDQKAISTEDQVALTTILTTNHVHQAKMDLQEAIMHLRDDHINTANELRDVKIRVSKLEDNVRALTAQRNVAQDFPRMAQEIEAFTRADSAPVGQVSEDDMTANGTEEPSSSQSTPKITTQPEEPKIHALEKPLPPVPAAAAYPATSNIKPEPLGNAWESGNSQPSSAAPQNNVHTTTSSWGASTLSAIPPVQIIPDTPRAGDESAPISRIKGKKKKWKDPPIFQDSQFSASGYDAEDAKDDTKTLFSYHDSAKASTAAHDTIVRSDAHEQKIAQPESTSPIRDVTNQTAAFNTHDSNTLANQPGRSRNDTPNNKRLFGDVLGNNNANHGQRLPPQFTATQTSAQTALAPAPAPQRTGVFSSPNAMRSMMQSVVPRANYVTTPAAATVSEENAVPRAPVTVTSPAAATASEARGSVVCKVTAPGLSGRTDHSVSSSASGSTVKSGRIAKRSTIKKVDTGTSRDQPVSEQPTAIVSPAQALSSSAEQVASSASLAAAPQLFNVSNPTTVITTPATTSRPTMNARVAIFHPSTSFTNHATRTPSPALPGGPIMTSLMHQMTPEAYARFTQRTNNV